MMRYMLLFFLFSYLVISTGFTGFYDFFEELEHERKIEYRNRRVLEDCQAFFSNPFYLPQEALRYSPAFIEILNKDTENPICIGFATIQGRIPLITVGAYQFRGRKAHKGLKVLSISHIQDAHHPKLYIKLELRLWKLFGQDYRQDPAILHLLKIANSHETLPLGSYTDTELSFQFNLDSWKDLFKLKHILDGAIGRGLTFSPDLMARLYHDLQARFDIKFDVEDLLDE